MVPTDDQPSEFRLPKVGWPQMASYPFAQPVAANEANLSRKRCDGPAVSDRIDPEAGRTLTR